MVDLKQSEDDLTGQNRLTWNVAVAWASQLVLMVIGFIMPRLIDEQLGQVSLGIWDFGWTITNYLAFAHFGFGANASRYVAKYRAEALPQRLVAVISTAHVLQIGVGVLVAAGATAAFFLVPQWLDVSPAEVEAARWVVFLLGMSLAVEMFFDVYRGVVTGVHRWDVHNGINTAQHVVSALGMVAVLLLGCGLAALAAVYVFATLMAELLRMQASHRFCPEAQIRLSAANRADAREITVFGLKNLVTLAGPGLIQQTVNLILALRFGPVLLAVFARPASLIGHLETFVHKFAFVLMPTASSLQGLGQGAELKRFAKEMSRAGWALAVPAGVFLLVYGSAVIELWMGPDYVQQEVMLLLAAGGALSVANKPAYRILLGLNAHGPASYASAVIYVAVLLIGAPVLLYADVGLAAAAMMFVSGNVLFNLFVVPHQLAKQIDEPVLRYLWQASSAPLLVGVVSYLTLLAFQRWLDWPLLAELAAAAVLHGTVVGLLYWRFVLSDTLKTNIRGLLGRFLPFLAMP